MFNFWKPFNQEVTKHSLSVAKCEVYFSTLQFFSIVAFQCVLLLHEIWDFLNVITFKQAKNYVRRIKNCQNFETYLCNATLM